MKFQVNILFSIGQNKTHPGFLWEEMAFDQAFYQKLQFWCNKTIHFKYISFSTWVVFAISSLGSDISVYNALHWMVNMNAILLMDHFQNICPA